MGAETAIQFACDVQQGHRETVGEWATRWLAAREERGLASVRDDRCRLQTHVLPVIGRESVARIDAERLEDIRDALDVKIRRQELAWRTAHHVWAVVRAMFRDASRCKERSLRVRPDDACRDIVPPDRGPTKEKQFLFPSEYLTLASCEHIPLDWRRVAVLSTCLYLRVSELEALEWDDVAIEHGTIHVHRSLDRSRGCAKATKSGVARRFLIEPTVLPLLRRLHREGGGRGRVLGELTIDRFALARNLRAHLTAAGVERADLFMNDRTRKWMTFHDLRATGITWMAVRGDDPFKIRQRAGHRNLATTERYIRVAEELRAGFGKVFPPLPDSLLQASRSRRSRTTG
jgi:integrase